MFLPGADFGAFHVSLEVTGGVLGKRQIHLLGNMPVLRRRW